MKLAGLGLSALLITAACGGDDSPADPDAATADAAVTIDAALPDASLPDAGRCGTDFLLEGELVDWLSTPEPQNFKGVFDAAVVEIGNKSNTVRTAPNGRINICVTPDTDTELRYTHPDYRTVHHSVSGMAMTQGPYSVRSLTTAQEAQFATDTGVSIAGASLLVEVRKYPSLDPVIGATVTFGGTAAGTFTQDGARAWVAGGTTTHEPHVLFTGISSAGSVTVTVTPPSGTTCVGRANVELVDGEITFTRFACGD